MPDISVITACAPADASFLQDGFESLKVQVGVDWEWVIVEDGPTIAAASVQDWDSRIRWSNTPHVAGPANARNLAITMATAPIIRNLDADDYVGGNSVLASTVLVFHEHSDVEYVVGPVVDLDESGQLTHHDEVLPSGRIEPGVLFRGWRDNGHVGVVHPTSLAARRGSVLARGGYPGLASSEDTALLLPLSQRATGYFMPTPVAVQRKRHGSITSTDWHNDLEAAQLRHAFIELLCLA